MAAPFEQQPIVVGDTILFSLEAEKDHVVWDITDGTVLLYFRKPGGVAVSPASTASITDGPAGKASWQCDVDFLDTAGDWSLRWGVTKDDVTLKSVWLEFSVLP